MGTHVVKNYRFIQKWFRTRNHSGLFCNFRTPKLYRLDLEKQEGCGVVAHERLIEPRVTIRTPSKTKEFLKSPRFFRTI